MCRNIKPLFNFEPPASPDEVSAAALQYVRKISGVNKPAKVQEIAAASVKLLAALQTQAPPKNRETEADKARARSAQRFAKP
jgi:hypothetical protein